MKTNRKELTEKQVVRLPDAESEQWEENRQTEPVVDQTMEETSRHEIHSNEDGGNSNEPAILVVTRDGHLLVTADVEQDADAKASGRDDRRDVDGQFQIVGIEKQTARLFVACSIGNRQRCIVREDTIGGQQINRLERREYLSLIVPNERERRTR